MLIKEKSSFFISKSLLLLHQLCDFDVTLDLESAKFSYHCLFHDGNMTGLVIIMSGFVLDRR